LNLDSPQIKGAQNRNQIRVTTSVKKSQILCSNDYSEKEPDLYRFCCPICLRYFNHILVCSRCDNYICRSCISQMVKRARQNPQYVIRCACCNETDFKLTDVDACVVTPREYTDTPARQRRRRLETAQSEKQLPQPE
jgi:hypothetical protein